ncbi:MAG TPA: arylesterase [Thermoanaerobaculia bacterium]|nr:arylesterase [Thermoanaerobaculia bacterium]
MRRALPLLLLLPLLLPIACGGEPAAEPSPTPAPPPAAAANGNDLPGNDLPRVVFLGDSLTAGYGLSEEQAFPALLEQAFADGDTPFEASNAGISGDTSAGGLSRVDWVLTGEPDVVVVALGANDGLRGIDPEATEENLRRIVERSRAAGARVLLAGMRLPPNYGADYVARFEAIYPRLANELDVPLVPFLLEGVGGDPELNQADGIHPTAEGQKILAETVGGYLGPLLE